MTKLYLLTVYLGAALVFSGCGEEADHAERIVAQAQGTPPPGVVETPPSSPRPEPPRVTAPARPAELTGVIRAYGPLVVRPGRFYAEATRKPWSASFLPLNSDALFAPNGTRRAPLQKYDEYARTILGRGAAAADRERGDLGLYDPLAPAWAGRCHAWAIASVVAPEPIYALRTRTGIEFGAGDLKALIVKTYERSEGLVTYGERFNDTAGATREDLYADEFHRLLQGELFEKKKPFLIDTDPGIQVWNHPVFRAFVRIDKDNADPTVLHVKTYLTIAKPQIPTIDFVGTIERDQPYAYTLHGVTREDGSFDVVYGEWKREAGPEGVDSLEDHPDFATVFPDDFKVQHHSENPEILNGEVDRLFEDSLELHPIPSP